MNNTTYSKIRSIYDYNNPIMVQSEIIRKRAKDLNLHHEYFSCDLSEPELTIIIRSYNNNPQQYERCLKSAIDEGDDFEILIVDDGSDIPLERPVLPNVSLLRFAYNCGALEARIQGIAYAKGKYIRFLDADDYLYAGNTRKQLELCKSRGLKVCGGNYLYINDDGIKINDYIYQEKANRPMRQVFEEAYIRVPYHLVATMALKDIALTSCPSGFIAREDTIWAGEMARKINDDEIDYFVDPLFWYLEESETSISSGGGFDREVYKTYIRDFEKKTAHEYFMEYFPALERIKSLGRKIKVAYVFMHLTPGGFEGRLIRLTNNLPKDLFEISFIILDENRATILDSVDPDVTVFLNDAQGTDEFLAQSLSRIEPDIIQYPYSISKIDVDIYPQATKYFYVARNDHLFEVPESKFDSIDRVLNVSPSMKEIPDFLKKKTIQLVNGIDITKFYPCKQYRKTIRESMDFSDDDFVVYWSGRMSDEHKRLDTLLQIIDNLESESNIKFLIAGFFLTTVEEGVFLTKIKNGSRIRWIKDATPEDAPLLCSAADVYLSTSDLEGMSNSSLEALAAGLPIVSTNIVSQRHMILHGYNGFLQKVGDHVGLANRISYLSEIPKEELAGYGKLSKRIARCRFDMDRNVREHISLYINDVMGIPYNGSGISYNDIDCFNRFVRKR